MDPICTLTVDKITSPYSLGGLGITNLKLRNEGLLAKWIWIYRVEKHTLWRRVIAAKFGSYSCDKKAGTRSLPTARGPWRAIFTLQSMVDQHVVVTLGNGHSVSFWFDSWVATYPLHSAFPNLFALSLAKEASVFNLWKASEGCWDLERRRNLFLVKEASQES